MSWRDYRPIIKSKLQIVRGYITGARYPMERCSIVARALSFSPEFSLRPRGSAAWSWLGGMRMPRVSIPIRNIRRLHAKRPMAICRGPLSGATLVGSRGKKKKKKKKKKEGKEKNKKITCTKEAESREHCRDDPRARSMGCTSFFFLFLLFFSCFAIDNTRFVEKWPDR